MRRQRMGLFNRRPSTPTSSADVDGLPELARSRGWQPIDGAPFKPSLVDQVWHVTWTLYNQREPLATGGYGGPPRRPAFHSSYAGEIEGRRIVVTNHS